MISVGPEKSEFKKPTTENMSPQEREFFHAVFDPVLESYQEFPVKFSTGNFLFNNFLVKIVFPAHSNISNLSKAVDHLRTDRMGEDILTIFCIDSLMKEFSLPFFPWENKKNSGKKEIPYYKKNGMFLSRSPESNVLSFLDLDRGIGIYWITDFTRLPDYERAAPFRTILQWWFESHGCEMIHSAAVGTGEMGALIPGGGGMGKSTISVLCLESGMDFFGDDYVLLCKNGIYKIASLYNTAKLDRQSLNFFPFLHSDLKEENKKQTDKSVVFLERYFANRVKNKTILKCILVPEISKNSISEIKKIKPSECFRTIAPSTLFQHIGKKEKIIQFLFELTNSVPCYKIFAGTNFKSTANKIKEVIKLN